MLGQEKKHDDKLICHHDGDGILPQKRIEEACRTLMDTDGRRTTYWNLSLYQKGSIDTLLFKLIQYGPTYASRANAYRHSFVPLPALLDPNFRKAFPQPDICSSYDVQTLCTDLASASATR